MHVRGGNVFSVEQYHHPSSAARNARRGDNVLDRRDGGRCGERQACRRTLKRDGKGHAFPYRACGLSVDRSQATIRPNSVWPSWNRVSSTPEEGSNVRYRGEAVRSVYIQRLILSILQHQIPEKQRHTMPHRQSIPMLSRIFMHEPRYRARSVRFVSRQIARGPPGNQKTRAGRADRRDVGSGILPYEYYEHSVIIAISDVRPPPRNNPGDEAPSDICADMAAISPLSA